MPGAATWASGCACSSIAGRAVTTVVSCGGSSGNGASSRAIAARTATERRSRATGARADTTARRSVGDDSATGDGGGPPCHPVKTCPSRVELRTGADSCGRSSTAPGRPTAARCARIRPPKDAAAAGRTSAASLRRPATAATRATARDRVPGARRQLRLRGGRLRRRHQLQPQRRRRPLPADRVLRRRRIQPVRRQHGLAPDGGVPCTPLTTCSNGQDCGVQGDGCGSAHCTCLRPVHGARLLRRRRVQHLRRQQRPRSRRRAELHADHVREARLRLRPRGRRLRRSPPVRLVHSHRRSAAAAASRATAETACARASASSRRRCDGGTQTTITGKVIAGTIPLFGTPDPVPNVLVYVANAPIQPFPPGVQCNQCGSNVSGNPLVQTTTAFDGTFTLPNVPATNVPPSNPLHLVIQLGYWRREFFFNNVPACQTTKPSATS